MRPGLLAVGLILLVLGGIFYMLPVDTAGTEQTTTASDTDVDTASVRTETYNTHDTTDTADTTTSTETTTTDTVDTVDAVDTTDRTTAVFPTRVDTDSDTTILAADDGTTTTTATSGVTTGVADAPLQRQLAVLAMILGAILTILGLVLPDPEPYVSNTVNTTSARTAAPASRRVYEREEERERRL